MRPDRAFPRLVVAGLGGDTGKTLVTLALILHARRQGIPVAAFKKGPDYIDAAWLRWASGRPARNLDTYLMGFDAARDSFHRNALAEGLNVVEGNRGLYDGSDARGTHSTAELAKLLRAPVILTMNVTKVTRTAAAFVRGCQVLDPEVRIAGVILNQVGSRRHESVIRDAVREACGVPVVGALPRIPEDRLLPGRHLGLVTPEEHPGIAELEGNIGYLCEENMDWEALLRLAREAPGPGLAPPAEAAGAPEAGPTIGVVQDSAFTFYYPENLEALRAAGARLRLCSPLSGEPFPKDLDALYVGGGFPETHGGLLAESRDWLKGLARAAEGGLPVYAECGGLMLLSTAIRMGETRHPMAGVLPFDVELLRRPQGHGYVEMVVDRPNPFYPLRTSIRGHEFHYSRIVPGGGEVDSACLVNRGTGALPGRDGILFRSVWASYTHVHALATPEWARGLVAAARDHRTGEGSPDPDMEQNAPPSANPVGPPRSP